MLSSNLFFNATLVLVNIKREVSITELKFVPSLQDVKLKGQIWEILCECDQEFIPPLSSRNDPLQCGLSNVDRHTILPYNYFYIMLDQPFIIAIDEGKGRVAGFMSFIHNYVNEEVGIHGCNYISTLCVRKEYRNQGLARAMYEFLINRLKGQYESPLIGTRTWSSNYGHIRLIESLGFRLVSQLRDHRGPGIDTVYYLYSKTSL